MNLSRRTFVKLSSLACAASACAEVLPSPSAKKGIGGAAPINSGLRTGWYYNWGTTPSQKGMPTVDTSSNYYPMCWGWNAGKSPAVLETLRAARPGTLFGFNEPDQKEQANMSAAKALEVWPMLDGIAGELVSPSCAHPAGPWMEEFMAGCQKSKLRVDAVGFHAYPGPSADAFIQSLENMHKQYKLPIWVTEFAVADWSVRTSGLANKYTVADTKTFMREACSWMNKTSWIRGYAWFPSVGKFAATEPGYGPLATSTLFTPNGDLTELGKVYASL